MTKKQTEQLVRVRELIAEFDTLKTAHGKGLAYYVALKLSLPRAADAGNLINAARGRASVEAIARAWLASSPLHHAFIIRRTWRGLDQWSWSATNHVPEGWTLDGEVTA